MKIGLKRSLGIRAGLVAMLFFATVSTAFADDNPDMITLAPMAFAALPATRATPTRKVKTITLRQVSNIDIDSQPF
jgi:hypothetical protein